MAKKKPTSKRVACCECGSRLCYCRIKSGEVVCRSCGCVSSIKKTKKGSKCIC